MTVLVMRLKIPVVMMKNDGDGSLFPMVLMNDGGFVLLCCFRVQFSLGV